LAGYQVYLAIVKEVGIDFAIELTGSYLYDILKKFRAKIRIGNKDMIDSDKDEIIRALKEEIEKLRKDLEKK